MQIHGLFSQSPWLSSGALSVGAVAGNDGSEKWLIEFIEESPLRTPDSRSQNRNFFGVGRLLGRSIVCLPLYRSLGTYLVLVSEHRVLGFVAISPG